MSTAEAISVVHSMGVHAYYYRNSAMQLADLVHFLIGAALKDNKEDNRRMKHYFETEVANKTVPTGHKYTNNDISSNYRPVSVEDFTILVLLLVIQNNNYKPSSDSPEYSSGLRPKGQ